ncbi:MAG: leucine-rich repeat protein [Clostridia bacterium]|nr:leucine-rich repeat protein [Clostridia bacterium]
MPLSQLFCSAATPRDNILKTEKKGLSSKNKKIIGITSAVVVGVPLICIGGFYILRPLFTKSTPQNNASEDGDIHSGDYTPPEDGDSAYIYNKFEARFDDNTSGIPTLTLKTTRCNGILSIGIVEISKLLKKYNISPSGDCKHKSINVVIDNTKIFNGILGGAVVIKKLSSNSLKEIYRRGFMNYEKLEEVYLPKLNKIYDEVFYNCKKLKKITVSSNVEIGKNAFKGCDSLKEICVFGGELSPETKSQIEAQCSHNLEFTTVSL